ncbi:3-dehydroquinate dehydratase [Streptomyces violarus]
MPRTLANAPIMILNGPNLNLLGQRQPEIYGSDTLADVEALCAKAAAAHGGTVDFRQSNHEGELVDWIHEARLNHCGIVIDPGAYSHTSVAILDALNTCDGMPVLEVHISNIHERPWYRRHYLRLAACRRGHRGLRGAGVRVGAGAGRGAGRGGARGRLRSSATVLLNDHNCPVSTTTTAPPP